MSVSVCEGLHAATKPEGTNDMGARAGSNNRDGPDQPRVVQGTLKLEATMHALLNTRQEDPAALTSLHCMRQTALLPPKLRARQVSPLPSMDE